MFSKIFGNVKGMFNITTIIELIISGLFIVLGVVLFSSNVNINLVTALMILLFIISGGSSIFSFIKRGNIEIYNYNLIFGIVTIIIGILTFWIYSLLILMALFLLVQGIQRIIYAFMFKKFNESSWIFTLLIGIFYISMGVLVYFGHGTVALAICILGYGIINFVNNLLLRKRSGFFID